MARSKPGSDWTSLRTGRFRPSRTRIIALRSNDRGGPSDEEEHREWSENERMNESAKAPGGAETSRGQLREKNGRPQ